MGLFSDRNFRLFPGLWVNYDGRGLSFNIGRPGFFVNVGGRNLRGRRSFTFSRGNPGAGVPYADMRGYVDGRPPYNRPHSRRGTSFGGWLLVLGIAGMAWYSYRHHTTPDALLRSWLGVPAKAAATYPRVVAADGVHLRAEPSTHGKIVATLARDEQVTVLKGSAGGWSHVRTSTGKKGYVASRFLR